MSDRFIAISRRSGSIFAHLLVYVLIWAGLALLIAAAGIRYFWGRITVGQMLLNLVSLETDGGGGSLVWMGIFGIGVLPLLITLAIAFFHQRRKSRRRHRGETVRSPRAKWAARSVSTVLVSALVVGGTTAFATTVGVADYIAAGNSKYDVGDYYVEPTVTSAEDKRNLVLIYLESGEETLANDVHFEKDAFIPLKEVTRAADGWQSVDSFQQYEGGGWTMAGLVSTMCGVPLKSAGGDSGNGVGGVDSYLGGATCLGDVLAEHGYTNVYLGGSNSSFAAKGTFLESHGYSEVKGLADWRAAGMPEESFRSDWGLSDEQLMAQARDKIDELYAESERTGQPFNLSMLTLDTHEPVHIYDYCTVDTENRVTSAFHCSMTQVAGFVEYMKAQGYLEDTAVIIMGDHLKHMSAGDAFHEQLDHHPNRTIFNRIWVPGQDPNSTLRHGVDQLSMYPTILEAAGLTVQGREAGLGVSAFAPTVPAASAQAMDPAAYEELLASRSARFFTEAWAGVDVAE